MTDFSPDSSELGAMDKLVLSVKNDSNILYTEHKDWDKKKLWDCNHPNHTHELIGIGQVATEMRMTEQCNL